MFGIINSSPKNVLVQGIAQKELLCISRKYISGRLLDIGCGEKPYAEIIKTYVTEHIGLDHENSLHDKSKSFAQPF